MFRTIGPIRQMKHDVIFTPPGSTNKSPWENPFVLLIKTVNCSGTVMTLELPTPKTQKKTGWSSGWLVGWLVGKDDFSRFGKAEAMYNLGAGQWHPELRFSDPIFGSSETMVQGYLAEIYGRRYWNTVTVYWWYIYETIL